MENYEQIFYLDHPHFTVGRVDQWGEQGYLLFEGKLYRHVEDLETSVRELLHGTAEPAGK